MQRRTLLKLGLGAAAVLAVAGGGIALLRPGLLDGRMTAAGRTVFHAVGRAVLDGSLPAQPVGHDAALAGLLDRLDETIAGLPAPTQAELSQVLSLLASAPGRIGLAGLGTDWPQAGTAEVQSALQGMRVSSLALRQQVYHALRDITNASYYADPQAWPLMGYPGQRPV